MTGPLRSADRPADRPADRLLRPLRSLRHLPDRLLHPLRRRRARRRVEEAAAARLGPPGESLGILFVCEGNICRSPYAAGALRRELPARLEERVRAESAGFFGPGRPSPPLAVEVARERGVALDEHAARLLAPEAVAAADLAVVMTAGQARRMRDRIRAAGGSTTVLLLGDLDPAPIRRRAVRDPIFQPRETFEAVYERIDRGVGALAEAVAGAAMRVAPTRQPPAEPAFPAGEPGAK